MDTCTRASVTLCYNRDAGRMLIPVHYSLELDVAFETTSFAGRVSINFETDVPVSRIELDSSGLTIEEATLMDRPVSIESGPERIMLTVPEPLGPGAIRADLAFRGTVQPIGPGLFMSGPFAATQLQPSSAGSLFPCIDSPAYKSTFDLTVTTSAAHTVVANAPLKSEEAVGDRRRFKFATSAPLPAYLFGVGVGPFSVESAEVSDVTVRLFSDGNRRLGFILEAATRFLALYETLLTVKYPWPKLDLVILPELGAAGLEMTSMIFLRESAVIGENGEAGPDAPRLVAHEIAHQWFGCLVSPSSWDDLWLSEGFATWLASKALAASGTVDEELTSARSMRTAMTADSLRSSRALRSAPANPGEIHELFDVVAYQKGAALLQMLEQWIGGETFRRALGAYLLTYRQGHAASSDLWRMLEDASGRPVATVATQFAERPLVPALRFDRTAGKVAIEQTGDPCTIPVSLKLGSHSGTATTVAIVLDSPTHVLDLPADTAWLMGNAGASGYYRCAYMRREIWPPDALSGAEAITALCDAWDQLWLNESSVVEYLQTVENLRGDRFVGDIAAEHVSELRDLLATDESRAEGFRRWLTEILPNPRLHPPGPATAEAAWNRVQAGTAQGDRSLSFDERADIAALAGFADPFARDEIARFFDGLTISGGQRTLEQTLERIDSRIAFRQREQFAFDAWLTHRMAPAVVADAALRDAYALLNAVAAGLHGAIVHRMWTEGLGLAPQPWMQPVADLRNALSAIERRLIAIFRGVAVIDAALFDLSARIQEDLLASSSLAERALGDEHPHEAPGVLATLLGRNAAVHDRSLRGAILFATLFGDDELAGALRSRLHRSHAARSHISELLDRVRSGVAETGPDVRAAAETLPAVQRSQAADLEVLVRRARAEK